MRTPQQKIDDAAARPAQTKRNLISELRSPTVLAQVASVHPLIATLPPAKQEAAALRLTQIAYTAAAKNSALLRCSTASVVRGVVEAAQLGLTVDGVQGHAYLVPYDSEAQLQIGYRGYHALAYRTGQIARIAAAVVHEHDVFVCEEGSAPVLRHQVLLRGERGAPIAAYALALLKGAATPLFVVLRLDEIEAHRSRSRGWKAFVAGKAKTSPWETDFDAMAQKTALRMLAKWLPLDEMQRAGAADEQVDHAIDTVAFALPAAPALALPEDAGADTVPANGELTEDEERRAFGGD